MISQRAWNLKEALDKREAEHDAIQKLVHSEQIEKKNRSKQQVELLTVKLLEKCKTWNGLFTKGEELVHELRQKKDDKARQSIVRTELQYYRQIAPHRLAQDPDLFKLNNVEYS